MFFIKGVVFMKKNILKIVLIIILVVIVIFLINTFRKFFIIQGLQENLGTYISSTNYYMKMSTIENDKTTLTADIYKKNGNAVAIIERDNTKVSFYNNGSTTDIFIEDTEGKKAELNSNATIDFEIPDYLKTDNGWRTFCASLFSNIKSLEIEGKEYYVLKGNLDYVFIGVPSDTKEIYIEKDTGLCLQLTHNDTIQKYEYEFDNVSDEIFIEPDVEQYEVTEK